LLSTNPIAVAVPGTDGPIVLDMATSVAAYGKVKTAAQRGETLPEGWMIDHQGRPLTDPKRAAEGLLVPIGGYKGYGLALVIGLLAGSLNGAAMGSETIDFNADDTSATNTGHAIVALSIAAFGEIEEFKRRVDKLVREIRRSKPMPGVERIWLPGEQSRAKLEERSERGVPIPAALREGLDKLAAELKIKPLGT
jgi:LDH2 family malate/lactate/ureidoglycolate dehydrogenase